MKNFVVISTESCYDYFIVNDLNELINEMYEVDLMNGDSFETVKGYFFNNYIVFESDSEIKEVGN
jgi:hypothetical protein